MNTNEHKGALRVSQEALSEISAAAVCETDNAVCGKNDVTVRYAGGAAEINLALSLKKSVRASACVETIQNAVRESVQIMTGITVSRVNVKICGQI